VQIVIIHKLRVRNLLGLPRALVGRGGDSLHSPFTWLRSWEKQRNMWGCGWNDPKTQNLS
jgi:hypothetical protein